MRNFNERCYIIAEIGGNFTTWEQAKRLVDGAAWAGVDCIKLQTYTGKTLVLPDAMFDMENTGKISQIEYFNKFAISKELHKKIFDYIDSKGLDYFSTPSHITDVVMLEELNCPAYKVGGDDATNLPLLKYLAKLGKPIYLSTGMCTMAEVEEAVNAILEEGNDKIVLFHTVSGYPTHNKDVNLNVIPTFKKRFPGIPIGFSDHTLGIVASLAAVAMGAGCIERHFTYDKNGDGPDHMLSSTPEEMKELVDNIRAFEEMSGSPIKMPFGPEVKNRGNNRKSVVTTKAITKGEKLTMDNIDIKRPGHGILPKELPNILGRRASKELEADRLLEWDDIN